MAKDNEQSRTQMCKRWSLPLDFIPLTREEFISQQRYIRDRAHEILLAIMAEDKPGARGVLAWQELALRADAALTRAAEIIDPNEAGSERISRQTYVIQINEQKPQAEA